MKNKKFLAGVLALVMMLSLSGCTLAVEGAGGEGMVKDRLIGAFITTESLIAFDMDAYLEENIEDLIKGNDVKQEDTMQSDERIYATVDKHDSIETSDWEISFGDIEGIKFFDAMWEGVGNSPFAMLTCDEEICDANTHYMSTDDSNGIELSGTIYILPKAGEMGDIYYINPVYQTSDGDIYTIPGDGNSVDGLAHGADLTITLSEETTTTKDEETESYTGGVEISFKSAYEPTEILVHQMDADNQVVKTDKYAPGKMPEKMKAEKNTAYVIVETQQKNPENPDECLREIYGPLEGGSTYMETFLVTENGGLGRMSTEIVWGE